MCWTQIHSGRQQRVLRRQRCWMSLRERSRVRRDSAAGLARLFSLSRRDFFAVAFVLLERWDRVGFPGLALGFRFAL